MEKPQEHSSFIIGKLQLSVIVHHLGTTLIYAAQHLQLDGPTAEEKADWQSGN